MCKYSTREHRLTLRSKSAAADRAAAHNLPMICKRETKLALTLRPYTKISRTERNDVYSVIITSRRNNRGRARKVRRWLRSVRSGLSGLRAETTTALHVIR